jgi:hypothetical protein
VTALTLASRSYQCATRPEERMAAAAAIASMAVYAIHCWGDIGFTEQKSIFLVAPAFAIAGQLAVTSGAWRIRPNAPLARQE